MISAKKHVSIIIPTYQRPDGLKLLLQSIARQWRAADGFQVVVIENHAQPLA
ncbi:glycosyl transferase, partial [bacterium]|nr:glycosyl transferase [bacterium]